MADHPIIFSAPTVRALLDGRKTQTRRVNFGVQIDRQKANDRYYVHNLHGGCFDVAEEEVGRIAGMKTRRARKSQNA